MYADTLFVGKLTGLVSVQMILAAFPALSGKHRQSMHSGVGSSQLLELFGIVEVGDGDESFNKEVVGNTVDVLMTGA